MQREVFKAPLKLALQLPIEAGNRATIEAGRQGGIQGDKAEETIIKVRLWAIPTEAPGRSLITTPNAF